MRIENACARGIDSALDTSEQVFAQAGDMLADIAKRYGADINALRETNPYLGEFLNTGEAVNLPARGSDSPAHEPAPKAAHDNPSGYTVQGGDTMSRIAKEHGLKLSELLRANPQVSNPNSITVGQKLHLPAAGDQRSEAPMRLATQTPEPRPAAASGLKGQRWEQAKRELVSAATSAGIDAGIVSMIANFESGFNAAARPIARDASRNKQTQFDGTKAMSTAHGYGQFLDQTWLGLLRTHGSKYGVADAAQLTQAGAAALRADPKLQAAMLAEFTRDNIKLGRQLGGADDAANVYALHNLGGRAGERFLRELASNPMKEVKAVLSAEVVRNNSSLYGDGSITLQDAYARMGSAMQRGQSFAEEARRMQNAATP